MAKAVRVFFVSGLHMFYVFNVPTCEIKVVLILFSIQTNINNPVKAGEGLDLSG
jgi:hypothetical protein